MTVEFGYDSISNLEFSFNVAVSLKKISIYKEIHAKIVATKIDFTGSLKNLI